MATKNQLQTSVLDGIITLMCPRCTKHHEKPLEELSGTFFKCGCGYKISYTHPMLNARNK